MIKAILKHPAFVVSSILVIGLTTYIANMYVNDNFHEVIPYQLYRSSQPEKGDLTALMKTHGIRSVINLRGENKGQAWYDDEVKEATGLGMNYFNFRMNSKRELSPDQIIELVNLMKNAPKPLLVHCKAGADRTGAAIALYMAAFKQEAKIVSESNDASEKQLSFMYGHFPSFKTDAMCKTLRTGQPLFTPAEQL